MDKDLQTEILNSIVSAGDSTTKINHIVGGHINHILNLSSGSARLQTNVIKRFNFIISQPAILSLLSSLQIRCCLCKKVISYPAWYYSVRYAVNHFHYFVCFDSTSPHKPSTKCYKKEIV